MLSRYRGLAVASLALILAGCATTAPTPSPAPSASPTASPAPIEPSASPSLAVESPSESPSENPSATPSATPVPTPTATPARGGTTANGWTTVPDQDSVQGVQYQHVIWTGTRFVATGEALDAAGVFLDSTDGLMWHRQAMAPKDANPAALASGPKGVVAVGVVGDRLTSWASTDGRSWTTHINAFPAPSGGTDTVEVTDVVATDTGWLAVGREDPDCSIDCGLDPVRALVWTSTDGLHWTRIGSSQSSLSHAAMTGVVRTDSGFVAVGILASRAAIWTSTDGTTWTRGGDDPDLHSQPTSGGSTTGLMVTGVATGHGVVVVVGMQGGQDYTLARAWWSTDGKTWSKASGDHFGGGQIFSVTATPEGFLATGPSGEGSCLGGIWASTDGHAWRCAATAKGWSGFGPYAAAASPTVEVVVGLTSPAGDTPNGLPGAVWERTVP